MSRGVSPLGLPTTYSDAVKTAVAGVRSVGPLVLPYIKPTSDRGAEVIGASASTGAGTVGVSVLTTAASEVGPLILPSKIRNLQPKVGSVSISLLGAGVEASGEEMEGANVSITLDGVTAGYSIVHGAGAGEVTVVTNDDPTTPACRVLISGVQKTLVFSGKAKVLSVLEVA